MKNIVMYLLMFILSANLFAQKYLNNQIGDTINVINQKNEKIGPWEEQIEGNLSKKGIYVNDKKDGMWITYFPNNMVQKIENFKNGMLHGTTFVFDNRGSITDEITYKNEVTNGPVRSYSYGRIITDATYKNGKLHGVIRKYYENSKLQEEIQYSNGVKSGFARWFSMQGHKVAEYSYSDGMLNGEQMSFYSNGKVSKKETYEKNSLNGNYEEYFENGNKKVIGKYTNDQKDGVWIEYDESGKVISEIKYNKGKIIK